MQHCVHIQREPLLNERLAFETGYLGVVVVCRLCARLLEKRLCNLGEKKLLSLEMGIESSTEAA